MRTRRSAAPTGARPARGQAFVELALVLPLVLLLVFGMVTLVQLARMQVAVDSAAEAAALVSARAADAPAACTGGQAQLASAVAASAPLAGVVLRNDLPGQCTGPVPVAAALPLSPSGGADAIWIGYQPGRAFCRIGAGPAGPASPGDVVVAVAVRPRIPFLPDHGAWLPLRLTARAVAKVDAFRSRDVAVSTEGDTC